MSYVQQGNLIPYGILSNSKGEAIYKVMKVRLTDSFVICSYDSERQLIKADSAYELEDWLASMKDIHFEFITKRGSGR